MFASGFSATRQPTAESTLERLPPDNCEYLEIGFGELGISKWAMDYCRMQPCSIRAIGDTQIALPELTRICKERIAGNSALQKQIRRTM